jgi:hypothetical protein
MRGLTIHKDGEWGGRVTSSKKIDEVGVEPKSMESFRKEIPF